MEVRKSMKLGSYQVLRRLARGGMSEVYVVLDERDAQVYALKMLRQQDEEDCQRFQQEIQILMRLQHPNILPILDADSHDDDTCYYIMPYIDRGTLKDRLIDGPLSPKEAETVLIQIADALEFLHQAGFIHRDIKPSNILQGEDGHVWLADFGLVRAIEGGSDLTRTGYLLGTPAYMAPELEKKPASAASDVYSLGVVLYEMLTGHVPFTGETLLDIYLKQVYEQPPLPSTLNPLLSPAIDEVILRALEKEPAQRYASAQALAEAYQEALLVEQVTPTTDARIQLGEIETLTLPPSVIVRQQPLSKRAKMPLVIGALVTMVVLTLSITGASVASHSGLSLFSLSPVHASSLPASSPTSAATPLKKRTSPGASPAGGSAQPASGGTRTPQSGTTPSTSGSSSQPGTSPSQSTPPSSGGQSGTGVTPPTPTVPPASTPVTGGTTPAPSSSPTTPPVNTPTTGGTTPTPVSTTDGNGNGHGGGKGNGNQGGNGNGQGKQNSPGNGKKKGK